MKLVASMNVHNEIDRYLIPCVTALLEFCDEVRVQDDGSTDGSREWLEEQDRVEVLPRTGFSWRENEGKLHQQLLDWTVAGRPTHVLAIDADEFVPHGDTLRAVLAENPKPVAFTLMMREVWRLGRPLLVRRDGGWKPHEVAICYRVDHRRIDRGEWRIWGRKMAGGRVPKVIRALQRSGRAYSTGLDILHLGWANPDERAGRYRRYAELDGGRYHAKAHLDSILLPDEAIALEPYDAPADVP